MPRAGTVRGIKFICAAAICLVLMPGGVRSDESALETANAPGSSTYSCLTTPLSETKEKRWLRLPIPNFVASISRPSARVKSPFPSASMATLPPVPC